MILLAATLLAAAAAIPVQQTPKLFPLVAHAGEKPWLGIYSPEQAPISDALKAKLWAAKSKPLPKGIGSSQVTKIVDGPLLKETLAAAGLASGETLFVKSFHGGEAIRLPIASIERVEAIFASIAQQEVGAPPESLDNAFVMEVRVDVSGALPKAWGLQPWTGVGWVAEETPFASAPIRNFDWKPAPPLFADSAVAWKRAQDKLAWEAGALGEHGSVVRAMAPGKLLAGLYVVSGEKSWTLYDFTTAAPPDDADRPQPDAEPALLKLQGAWKFLLQLGDIGSPYSKLILIDAAGAPVQIPLRWGDARHADDPGE